MSIPIRIHPVKTAAPPAAESGALDPDAPIVRAVIAGDVNRYGELVDRHHASIVRVLCGIIGDAHLAEDVTQEVWLIAYKHLHGFEFRSRFRTWLHRIAIREALSTRARFRRMLASVIEPQKVAPPPDADISEREEVRSALSKLPAHERATFVLYVEGFGYEEIAEALKCSAGTVATRIHRARRWLSEHLGMLGVSSAELDSREVET